MANLFRYLSSSSPLFRRALACSSLVVLPKTRRDFEQFFSFVIVLETIIRLELVFRSFSPNHPAIMQALMCAAFRYSQQASLFELIYIANNKCLCKVSDSKTSSHFKVVVLCRFIAIALGFVVGVCLSQHIHPRRASYSCSTSLGPEFLGNHNNR